MLSAVIHHAYLIATYRSRPELLPRSLAPASALVLLSALIAGVAYTSVGYGVGYGIFMMVFFFFLSPQAVSACALASMVADILKIAAIAAGSDLETVSMPLSIYEITMLFGIYHNASKAKIKWTR